jgi:hypothetical protein
MLPDHVEQEASLRRIVPSALLAVIICLPEPTHAQYRGGAYGELVRDARARGLTVVISPCLQLLAEDRERRLGRPMTRQEFGAFRDMMPAIQMDPPDAAALQRRRGCADPESFDAFNRAKGR